jgi:thiamine-monophosphate kinase
LDDQAWDELALVDGIARRATWDATGLVLGDDAAMVHVGHQAITVCADALVEGVHFDLSYWSPAQIGAKAVTVNVSDLAAMAAEPLWILSTVAAPKSFAVEELLIGLEQKAEHYSTRLIGGDLTRADTTVVSVMAIGKQSTPPLRRSGAHAGELIFVTGPLGLASHAFNRLAQGLDVDRRTRLALLDPIARVQEGRAAARGGATAAIDISDGLAIDLHRLADASRVGFVIDELPIAEGATELEALAGGEDFELCFTAPDHARVIDEFAKAHLGTPLVIGRVIDDVNHRMLGNRPLAPVGYRH